MTDSTTFEIPAWICDHYDLPTLRFRGPAAVRGVLGPVEGHCYAEGIGR